MAQSAGDEQGLISTVGKSAVLQLLQKAPTPQTNSVIWVQGWQAITFFKSKRLFWVSSISFPCFLPQTPSPPFCPRYHTQWGDTIQATLGTVALFIEKTELLRLTRSVKESSPKKDSRFLFWGLKSRAGGCSESLEKLTLKFPSWWQFDDGKEAFQGPLHGSVVKNLPANSGDAGDAGSIPGPRRPWRRKWQPTGVFLYGKFQGQRSLVGYRSWDHKELDTTEWAQSCAFCNSFLL